jgi:N-acetylmuramoyl-L-alanine amidase
VEDRMRSALQWIERGLLVLFVFTLGALAYLAVRAGESAPPQLTPSVPTATPTSVFLARHPQPRPQTLPPKKVGILPGHWQNDSGATCEDGLTEAEVTLSVAKKVQSLLRWYGYEVELLPEFSLELQGYQAFLAIHADSCEIVEGVTGFKVARADNSAIPEKDDRLVACLWKDYAAATGLRHHEASITTDMLHYHALKEIAPETPGAIIEIGFLGSDRHILVFGQDAIAQGLANALICFLEGAQ